MDLDTITIGEAREIARMFGGSTAIPEHPYPVGRGVFIRTVTHYYTGRLVRVTAGELVLEDAAWIADTGRFHAALASGNLDEVEPFPAGPVIVPRGGVLDVSLWPHDLPREAK